MAQFENAFEKMLQNEGGYKLVNVAGDSGGQTYAGIARNYHSSWKGWNYIDSGDLTNPKLKELVQSFYKSKFWDKVNGDNISNQNVAESIFDFAVNAGVSSSAKTTQRIIGAKDDGKIGPNTLEILNKYNEEIFLLKFALSKIEKYADICNKNSSQKKFLLGWINRTLKESKNS